MAAVILSGKAVARQALPLAQHLCRELAEKGLDDKARFLEAVLSRKAELENELAENGSDLAARRAAARLGPAEWVAEGMDGIAYLDFLRRLIPEARKNWPRVHEKLAAVLAMIIDHSSLCGRLAGDQKSLAKLHGGFRDLLERHTGAPCDPPEWLVPEAPRNEGFIIPSRVNHISQAINLRAAGWRHDGFVHIVLNHLEPVYLYSLLRNWGGAYAPDISYNSESGILNLTSGFDINIRQSLEIFRGVPDWLRAGSLLQD